MSSMKDIKQRMANVSQTLQIIKAMDMVSGAKLRKAKPRLDGVRALHKELSKVMHELRSCEELREHAFVKQREVKNSAYVIITSDRGLCGSYNTNISEKALSHMDAGKNEKIIVIGKMGTEYFRRRNKNILRRAIDVSEVQIYEAAGRIGEFVSSLYASGEVDEVFVAYTYFESTLSHIPRVEKVLPISDESHDLQKESSMKYEPDAATFLEHVMPLYLHTCFFAASSEAVTCEHAARMMNMDSAGKNANDIVEDLGRMYNRKRQAAITQELNEIVSGANILK